MHVLHYACIMAIGLPVLLNFKVKLVHKSTLALTLISL